MKRTCRILLAILLAVIALILFAAICVGMAGVKFALIIKLLNR